MNYANSDHNFTNIHHKMRQTSTNMADFNIKFLSDYKELGNKTCIYKNLLTVAIKLPSNFQIRT